MRFGPHIVRRMPELFQNDHDRSWCEHDTTKQKNKKSQVDKKVGALPDLFPKLLFYIRLHKKSGAR